MGICATTTPLNYPSVSEHLYQSCSSKEGLGSDLSGAFNEKLFRVILVCTVANCMVSQL